MSYSIRSAEPHPAGGHRVRLCGYGEDHRLIRTKGGDWIYEKSFLEFEWAGLARTAWSKHVRSERLRKKYAAVYAPKPSPAPTPKPSAIRCPFCHDSLAHAEKCRDCGTGMHPGCWRESFGVCATCKRRNPDKEPFQPTAQPATEGRSEVETFGVAPLAFFLLIAFMLLLLAIKS